MVFLLEDRPYNFSSSVNQLHCIRTHSFELHLGNSARCSYFKYESATPLEIPTAFN
jgi:hypothetical protein